MTRSLAVLAIALAALTGTALADKPKLLVLPLPPSHAVDAAAARAFDARLLVALDDTRRVATLTGEDEPECTTLRCLAELGSAAGASYVLSLSLVGEPDGLTVFGTVVDVASAKSWRRVELSRLTPAALAKMAPAQLVPQIVGPPPGRAVLGVTRPGSPEARTAALALTDRLSALRGFEVAALDGADRAALTHRAELAISELSIAERRRHLCTWLDGTLVGTFTITDLATGRVVFTRTVSASESERAHFTTREQIAEALVAAAVDDWMAAFQRAGVATRLASRR